MSHANLRQRPMICRVLLPKPPLSQSSVSDKVFPKQSTLLYSILIYQDVSPLIDKNQVKKVLLKGVLMDSD